MVNLTSLGLSPNFDTSLFAAQSLDRETDPGACVTLHPCVVNEPVDEEEAWGHLGPEGDPNPAADQSGHGVVSGQGHLGGDKGEEGSEGDPSTVEDSFSVRTVPWSLWRIKYGGCRI